MRISDQKSLKEYGLLSERPLADIPRFEKVSRLVRQLPELIAFGSTGLRETLDALPFIDVKGLDEREARALMRDYHYLQSAYVNAEPGEHKIPESLAVPSHILAKTLGRKPMLSYASVILDNWQLGLDGEYSVLNLRPII